MSLGVSRLQTNSRDGGTQCSVETAGPGSSGSGTRQWIRQDLDVDTARPGCGGGETRQYKDSGTRQWMASLGLR